MVDSLEEEVMNLGSIVLDGIVFLQMRVGSIVVVGETLVEFNEEVAVTCDCVEEGIVTVVVDGSTLTVEVSVSDPDDGETSKLDISIEDFSVEGLLSLDKS